MKKLEVLSITGYPVIAGILLSWCFLLFPFLLSAQEKMLADKVAYYPRVIRLQHSGSFNGRLIASFDSGNTGSIYQSTDEGVTWNPVYNLSENTPPRNCCSELYEVPAQLKDVAAGTLFWATSVGTDRTPRTDCSIRIYKSTDHGLSWDYHATGVNGVAGLWEAEFAIDNKGRLLMFYSSEEHKASGFNQLIAHRVSTDGGYNWSKEVVDVAMNDNKKRPGMPTVIKLPDSTYVMCYEICGLNCDTYIRKSEDGSNWGDPAFLGTRVESAEGHHFSHAPTIAWANDGSANGKLLVIGQVLKKNSDNAIAENNGKVFMVNSNGGSGLWTEVPVPVITRSDGSNPCENYSSQLLPSRDGKTVLELALKGKGGVCRLFYNNGSLTGKDQ